MNFRSRIKSDRCVFKVKEFCRAICKFFKRLYKRKPNEGVRTKRFIGFIIGLLSAICFYYAIVEKLDVSPRTRRLLGTSLGCIFCLGATFSIGIRCVFLLVFPVFFGRSGRSILSAIGFSLLVQGPIENISKNMEEMARVFSCAGDMAINLTLHRLELIYHPVHEVIRTLKIAGHDIQGKVNLFTDAIYPLVIMLEDDTTIDAQLDKLRKIPGVSTLIMKMNKTTRNGNDANINDANDDIGIGPAGKLTRKIATQCIDMASGPIQVCKDIDEKIQSHFNNLDVAYEGSCPPEIYEFCDDVHGPGKPFDEGYFAIKRYAQQVEQMFDVNVVFPMESVVEMNDYKNVEYAKEKIKDEFSYRIKVLGVISNILQKALGFIFIIVFISAIIYQKDYLNNLSFDNCYVTSYFRKIDKRRKAMNKRHLLPLKHLETLELIRPEEIKMLPEEKRKLNLLIQLKTYAMSTHYSSPS